ncbi:UvrD-helicase domain-containing protein [Alsobacter sp. SYSU BS001988]
MVDAARITTVVASAGTGKTTRLVSDIAAAVIDHAPESVLATTFTVKAAAELIERARATLFEAGRAAEAARLLGARCGTVNSVCAQIVAECAIDLGRSPQAHVLPEAAADRLLRVAAAPVFEQHAAELNALSDAFGHYEPRRMGEKRPDWRDDVRRIVELARANGLGADALAQSAAQSVASFAPLLASVSMLTEHELDERLFSAIDQALAVWPVSPSVEAKKCHETLIEAQTARSKGALVNWQRWGKLAKVKCALMDGPDLQAALDAVRRAASAHPGHPRLRRDCERFIWLTFTCAAESLQAFQDYKSARGLVDFVDQESLALQALTDNGVRQRLSERIRSVFVDEFQDSSPLQIAIFTALAEFVDASTWVGDPKQAIYGFRNADSALTQAAFDGVAAGRDGAQEVLARSYRSRSALVHFANAAFGPAFEAMGLPSREHAFSGTERQDAGIARAALGVWELGGIAAKQCEALAAQIQAVLAEAESWPVSTRSGAQRPIIPSDIVVLCRSNDDMRQVARALAAQGLQVAVAREGWIGTPHGQLVHACLRWIADDVDTIALAELARFFDDDPQSDRWLAAAASASPTALRDKVPVATDLASFREQLLALTPAELVDAVIALPLIQQRCAHWGELPTALDDLEALRGFVREFEEACAREGAPATAAGLVLALAAEPPQRPASLQADAVQVMTYHAAKGLEWPLVVLTSLHHAPRPRLFEPVADAEGAVDWRDPLGSRWIRFWPWPYGLQKQNVGLDQTAPASPLGQRAARQARDEETRLLYVGVTRARDYLIFAPVAGSAPKWLSVLNDSSGADHVRLPRERGEAFEVGGLTFDADWLKLTSPDARAATAATATHVGLPRAARPRLPLRRTPSSEASDSRFSVSERLTLGPRLPITGAPDMQRLGEAVHAIFAADQRNAEAASRLTCAQKVLDRWGVREIAAADVLAACDRLSAFVSARWRRATLHREAPVFARVGQQLVSGRIDLVIDDPSGLVVIDHKTFPGAASQWDARAISYGSQLRLYAEALQLATGRASAACYIHLPVAGVLLRVADGQSSVEFTRSKTG